MIASGEHQHVIKSNNIAILLYVSIAVAIIAITLLIVAIFRHKKTKSGKSTAAIVLLSILVIACFPGIIFVGVGYKATDGDIAIKSEQSISPNMTFDIYAYNDINDLEITFEFADNNGTILTKKVKNIGDIERGKTYQVSISFKEFNLTEIMKITKTSAKVTGGRGSYL